MEVITKDFLFWSFPKGKVKSIVIVFANIFRFRIQKRVSHGEHIFMQGRICTSVVENSQIPTFN